jgi:plasmid stability protein
VPCPLESRTVRFLHAICPIDINDINDYNGGMASMMIRNLDETVKKRLRLRAAEKGRSLEAEVRDILSREAGNPQQQVDLGEAVRRRFAPFGGVELETFPDEVLHLPRKRTRRNA